MTLPTTLARAAVITAVGLSSLALTPSSAAEGTARSAVQADGGVVLTVELLDTPLVPDGEMRASVTVTNSTDDALASGHVVLSAGDEPFSSRNELATFLDVSAADTESSVTLDTLDVPAIDPSSTWTSTPVTVTSDDLDLPETFGAYAFSGTYVAGSATAQSRDAFAFQAGETPDPVTVAIAVPITLPPTAESLVSAEDLAAYTSEEGSLTQQLNGVLAHDVAIAIDPRIIASVRALGSAAPESAVEWLRTLETSGHNIFPLQYADADPTAQLQSGASALQQPSSLMFGIDPNNFTPVPDDEPDQPTTPTGTETPSPNGAAVTPTPTPPVDPDGIPSLDTLLEFPYTFPSAVWPDDDTVTKADLSGFENAKLGPVILSSSNTSAGAHSTVDAKVSLGDTTAFIADSAASDDLRRAATAASDTGQSDALAALEAKLAVIAGESGAGERSILLTMDRTWPTNAERMSAVLSTLESTPGVAMTDLESIELAENGGLELVDKPQSEERISAFTRIASFDDDIAAFSTALSDPSLLIGRHDAAKLTAYSIGWRSDLDGWSDAVAEFEQSTNDVLNSVTIVQSSPILMIADQISIKISVRNSLDLPVHVIMRASPDNPRLAVESSELTEIPAETQQAISIPVTARLGNGDVNLRLNLYTAEGVSLTESSTVPVTVRADWERIGTIILIAGVSLLFIFGVIRTVLRRRREHAAADTQDSASDGDEQAADDASRPEAPAPDEPPTERESD
ncbi:DUF6049 family protein [Paramicrobacterium agarici]|uniref:Secreted protein n=1 Tax=Paramicrobacterium agarici TaxID=630514 RepID=A0A2A9DSX9_9MICO|nr:DUF6049 family protein [Microbacterium agarici]PFG29694.1 hypothetical protein ATJ78_0609 [Microbacterium agarici]TQO22725.1 hypothetical protein FB385_1564 [Microbacterium agarici]